MKTHCKIGHEFTVENTYTYPNGERACRTCRDAHRVNRQTNRTPEKKEHDKIVNKRSRIKNDARIKQYEKGAKLHRMYGVTLEQYNEKFEQQGGRCIICQAHQSELKYSLCVDHNHDTGEVRDLLCSKCNSLLGYCREDIGIMETAIEYLRKHDNLKVKIS